MDRLERVFIVLKFLRELYDFDKLVVLNWMVRVNGSEFLVGLFSFIGSFCGKFEVYCEFLVVYSFGSVYFERFVVVVFVF